MGKDCYLLLQKNITGAHQLSQKPPKSVVKVIRTSAPIKDAVYNYSIQMLNSTKLAKKELVVYQEMAKVSVRHREWETARCLSSRQSNSRWLIP